MYLFLDLYLSTTSLPELPLTLADGLTLSGLTLGALTFLTERRLREGTLAKLALTTLGTFRENTFTCKFTLTST